MSWLSSLALVVALAPQPAPVATSASSVALRTFVADPLGVTEVTLNNGLRVFMTENHERPEVFGAVVVNTGAKNDPADNTGMAHYLEHMLFKGTQSLGTTDWAAEQPHQARIERLYDALADADGEARAQVQADIQAEVRKTYAYAVPNELDQALRILGGRGVNAFTSYDETVYHNTVPASQLEPWLEIYAHRFVDPVFRLFPSELEAVYEEKNIALDTTGYSAFRKALRAAFPDHPYGGTDILGEVEHLKRPSLSAMRSYFETYYVPGNMALVLSGDFDTQAVLPILERTFGTWKAGAQPPETPGEVKPFGVQEKVSFRGTPVRAGAIVYRTPAERDPEYAALSVIRQLLSNEQRSGLVDNASDGGKLLFALHVPADFADHNLDVVVYVPRLLSQTFAGAERAASAPFEAIARGEFDDATFEAIKASLLQQEAEQWEDNEARALAVGHAFVARDGWQGHLDYLARLEALTKADVVRVAGEVFGERRLRVRSRVGFPKKLRLDKPQTEPVTARAGVHSAFYEGIAGRPSEPPRLRAIDFGTDLKRVEVDDGLTVVTGPNPFNDLFELEVRFGVGNLAMREQQLVAELLPRLGTYRRSPEALREAWFSIGSTLEVESELDAMVVRVRGPQRNFDAALALLSEVLVSAKPDAGVWRKVRRERWGFRRLELRDPGQLGVALRDYVVYGDLSPTVRDYGPKSARRYSAADLVDRWVRAQRYAAQVRYAGPQEALEVARAVQQGLATRTERKPAVRPVVLPRRLPEETTVFFLADRSAVQSQVWFAVDGTSIPRADAAAADAFAEYFGGSMAGLVFQEIREFRALAYSAGARLERDARPEGGGYLRAFVGCQADKTFDALDVMMGLIDDMPRYPDRMDIVRASLSRGLEASSPSFRALAGTVADWQQRGYRSDPRPQRLLDYGDLTFADIEGFYGSHVKGRPVAIMIVGDPRRVDPKELERYGPVVRVKVGDVLSP